MIRRDAPAQATTGTKRGEAFKPAYPNLKVENLSKTPKKATIIAAMVPPPKTAAQKYDPPAVIVKVDLEGRIFLWNIGARSPVLQILCTVLGDDENNWPGKEFMAWAGEPNFYGRSFIEIAFDKSEPEQVEQPTKKEKRK